MKLMQDVLKQPGLKLQDVEGFISPYNDLFWALAHYGLPFNFCQANVAQHGATKCDDFVVKHPVFIADGKDLDHYESKI